MSRLRNLSAVVASVACLASGACEAPTAGDPQAARPLQTSLCGWDDPDCPTPPRETPPTATFKYWSGGTAHTYNLEKYVELWSVSQSFENVEYTSVSATLFLRDNCASSASTRVVYDRRDRTVVGSPAWAEVKFVTPRWTDPRRQEWSSEATHRFVPYSWARGGGTYTSYTIGRCY
jgi:hypothetical protein